MALIECNREQSCVIRQNVSLCEHRDLQATAMSVDWSGQLVLLAGRHHLALQNLEYQDVPKGLRKYTRNSKYDVSAAEWAICENSQEYCALATSQLIEVVTWSRDEPTLIHSLRAHTRMVTDIDWHSKEPHLLASCSIDTFTHLWDLRDPRKPILSLSAVCMSGANQVGFNRVSGNLLATAHDGDLRIWDIRKGSCPIQYITAHLARIHGINWSHSCETYLTTSSQDGTIKYFDVNNPRRAENIITALSPVWRARYTPVGNGLVSVIVPHLGRGENSLLLWSNSKQDNPISSFVGHTDVILDFAWKRSNRDSSEIEFLTWSRDHTLRRWKIDEHLLKLCEATNDLEDECSWDNFKTARNSLSTDGKIDCKNNSVGTTQSAMNNDHHQTIQASTTVSYSLKHEFSLLNMNIPHIEIKVLDAIKRFATIKASANGFTINLQINFPLEYPKQNGCPEFEFIQNHHEISTDQSLTASLMKVLKSCAMQRVRKERTCLEQCLRSLVTALKRYTGENEKAGQMRLHSPKLEGALSGALHDACIPFPRTSGCSFNHIGILVVFSQPYIHTKRISLKCQNTTTPRALSAISGGYLGNVMGSQPVLYTHRDNNQSSTSIYLQDRVRKNTPRIPRNSRRSTQSSCSVHVYDLTRIINLNKDLAKLIRNYDDLEELCKKNLRLVESLPFKRSELIDAWNIATTVATRHPLCTFDKEKLQYQDYIKKSLLESLIVYFIKNGDVQTAITLLYTFERCYTFGDAVMESSQTTNGNYNINNNNLDINEISSSSISFINSDIDTVDFTGTNPSTVILSAATPPSGMKDLRSFSNLIKSNIYSSSIGSSNNNYNSFEVSSNSQNYELLLLGGAAGGSSNNGGGNDGNNHNNNNSVINLMYPNKLPSTIRIKKNVYDNLKRIYNEILYGWNLLTIRALILKYSTFPSELSHTVEFVTECFRCNLVGRSPYCNLCRKSLFYCSLCRLPVKGAANFCLICGHGGHTEHIGKWFSSHEECALGCGCNCLQNTAKILN